MTEIAMRPASEIPSKTNANGPAEVVRELQRQMFGLAEFQLDTLVKSNNRLADRIVELRNIADALRRRLDAVEHEQPSKLQIATALTAGKLIGKRQLGEVQRGAEKLRSLADTFVGHDGRNVVASTYIANLESKVRSVLAEWHLVKDLPPSTKLITSNGGAVDLHDGRRKAPDHLRLVVLRTVERVLGGDPAEHALKGHMTRMPRACAALVRHAAEQRSLAVGLQGDARGDARAARLFDLLEEAKLLLVDGDMVEAAETVIAETLDHLRESANRSEGAAQRMSSIYLALRRMHLDQSDDPAPPLSGEVRRELERMSAELEKALEDAPPHERSYRLRFLRDGEA